MPFTSILIANRGEIAVRIIRSARALGYRTVAVFSPVDEHAPHVALADEAVALAGNEPGRSYLDSDQLLAAANRTGADAVHPGYGFLSENAAFASACSEAGLVFIGPPAGAIRAMGNKREAKALMEEAGVPVIPGARGTAQAPQALLEAAVALGCPVMIKAAAGGGGKGMRRVDIEGDLADGIRAAASEARSSFGDDELIIERAIDSARHVEIQVFADALGHVIHLGERDCSMQRRHQKIIEESPSPAVDAELRRRMGEAACRAARAIDYVGAGTVEFLLDPDGQFYFLEMNTRLQVEHPVTEAVTGFDLVAWQLEVAAGRALPVTQDQVSWQGHAIEARLYAEAPEQNFMPQSGTLLNWRVPDDIRVDSGVEEGQVITPHYDPLLAKFIAHGPDRETARRRLLRALERSVAVGLITNRAYLCRALAHPAMVAGEVDTAFVDRHAAGLAPPDADPARLAVVAALLAGAADAGSGAPRQGWRRRLALSVDAGAGPGSVTVDTARDEHGCRVSVAGAACAIDGIQHKDGQVTYRIDGRRRRAAIARAGDTLWLADEHGDLAVIDRTLAPPALAATEAEGRVEAPMDGTVIETLVAEGDTVARDAPVLIMEAMKMETTLRAGIDGVVGELSVSAGASVRKGQRLALIEAVGDEPG